MSPDYRKIRAPGTPISDEQSEQSETKLGWCENPAILEDISVRLEEAEDQRIAEAREERQEADDRLCQQHFVRSEHEFEHLIAANLFVLGRSLDVFIALAYLLRPLVEHDGRACLWNEKEVYQLDNEAKNKLDPEVPAPMEVLLDRAATNAADDCHS